MPFRIGPWETGLFLLISLIVIIALVVNDRLRKNRNPKFQKQTEVSPYRGTEEGVSGPYDKHTMIIECSECGTKNQTLQPPQPNKRYRCGKCGTVITFLQTIDTLSEITSVPATLETEESSVIAKENRKWDWSEALKTDGRFSRSQFASFYFLPIITTYILFILTAISEIFLIIAVLWSLLQVYVVIVAGIRRLHDLNYSGWYLLFGFIPFVNIGLILYLLFAPGKVEGNRWV